MLEASELEVTRGDAVLFGGLDIRLESGGLLRVAGANGSGKTSLLRALCGLLLPTAGEVRWNGINVRTLREEFWKHLAYVGHSNGLKEDLSAEENLSFACALSGIGISPAQSRAAIEAFGLGGREKLPVRVLSQGQRRRAALARLAISQELPLWVLDEPFAALDTAAVDAVRTLVEDHLARSGIVILTTHQEARIRASSSADINLDR